MKMLFNAFAKKLFGAKYNTLLRTFLVNFILFWGLHITEWHVQIAPSIFYLMGTTFSAGMLWQALSSKDNAAYMQNLFMLPFENKKLTLAYTAAFGAYILFTKTATLFAVVLAVSDLAPAVILGGILCAVNAVFMTAAIYAFRKYWYIGVFWGAAVIAGILLWGTALWFMLLILVNMIIAVMFLQNADGFSFYFAEEKNSHTVKHNRQYSVWRYFFRYFQCHKNYCINMVAMCCLACVLPLFFGQIHTAFAAPMGFAILSINTPIAILLSCDPSLEQAVRFLPAQKKRFCIPYCLFIFLVNSTVDAVFLCSMQFFCGGVTLWMIAAAISFALQSAIGTVLLEWFYPIRGWKSESDLWHHPRKYLVPTALLLLAATVGTLPKLVSLLIMALAAEVEIGLCWCLKEH